MSADSGVPDSGELVENADNTGSVADYLGRYGGGVGAALAFLLIAPIRAAATGGSGIMQKFMQGIGELLYSVTGGSGDIVDAGVVGTSEWVRTTALGFVIAVALVLLVGIAWNVTLDATDSDLPFWQRTPVLGFFFSDDDEQ